MNAQKLHTDYFISIHEAFADLDGQDDMLVPGVIISIHEAFADLDAAAAAAANKPVIFQSTRPSQTSTAIYS